MSSPLFREEVAAAQRERWLGTVLLRPPRFGWFFLALSALVLISLSFLIVFGEYTAHEHVRGVLVPTKGVVTVNARSSGVVAKILVSNGARVRAGQALVKISRDIDSASMGNTYASIIKSLKQKKENLESQLKAQAESNEQRKGDLKSRVRALKLQLSELGQQVEIQRVRANSAQDLYEQWKKIGDTGVVSKLRILNQRDTALESISQLKQLLQKKLELAQKLADSESKLRGLPLEAELAHKKIQEQLSDVSQSISSNAAEHAVVLRAPVAGVVSNLFAYPGQSVAQKQELVDILPKGSKLQAELVVPSSAIGFIRKGDRVVLHYKAFPYQRFGQYYGGVSFVSNNILSSSDIENITNEKANGGMYRVIANIDKQEIYAYGRKHYLKSGMALEADVILGRSKILYWFVGPLRHLRSGFKDEG
ncbi:HlyD family efflux transporter periplasmic adaptor subunit [Oleiagrimonas citrea]|uniref:HlyD family efflux transporter periplasmic adaptor subunit n=1 Tax=Oleiagrimonas citrea TaxID=1665687 RepID=A0A846ZKT9_9GAMM|nr:HlyD family efflux transporter periplasmic adaptor subunit [Oleiagrimonas citrea]NKZ38794.1 HlyD family efflux transporter periplasmic adaptor subunit [Oleiagrimonas citrea]